MKTLRVEFKQSGFNLKQVVRNGAVAIYEKTKQYHTRSTFEVVKVGTQSERHAFGVTFEACETYPYSETWGVRGWTCSTKECAIAKMNEWLAQAESTHVKAA